MSTWSNWCDGTIAIGMVCAGEKRMENTSKASGDLRRLIFSLLLTVHLLPWARRLLAQLMHGPHIQRGRQPMTPGRYDRRNHP